MVQRFAVIAAAALVAISVYALNGQPLFYFDTASYLEQGTRLIGLPSSLPEPPAAPQSATVAAAPTPDATPDAAPDTTVVGSRSVAYGVAIALVAHLAGLPGIVAVNLLSIWIAAWIVARRLGAGTGPAAPAPVAAVGLLAGSLGSLAFYVAFAMPDIFAPILILMVAALFVHGRQMSWFEAGLAVALALFAIIAHPSHLLLFIVLAPVAFLAGPMAAGRRVPLALALIGLLAGAGLAERFVFGMAVERYLQKRVIYLPFATARLIDDGPGLYYLQTRCPDADYPTCTLLRQLEGSDDPARLDAPNILFSRSQERGSFRLLSASDQAAVAEDQLAFLKDVVTDAPGDVLAAIGRNVLVQLGYFSVEMTIPTPDMVAATEGVAAPYTARLRDGRLVGPPPPWVPALFAIHAVVYLASLLVIGRLFLTGRLSRDAAAVTAIVLAGIVANAAVCGAVSEPAHRYGARVMFLLPMLAAMLWMTRLPRSIARP
jgi:hypothetical protein